MNKIESPEESRKLLDKIVSDLTRSIVKKDELTRFWFFILIMFVGVGLWGWIVQIDNGLGVTGMRDYVSWGLYIVVGTESGMPMTMTWQIATTVLVLAIVMCVLSGLAALRKLYQADPADLF